MDQRRLPKRKQKEGNSPESEKKKGQNSKPEQSL